MRKASVYLLFQVALQWLLFAIFYLVANVYQLPQREIGVAFAPFCALSLVVVLIAIALDRGYLP